MALPLVALCILSVYASSVAADVPMSVRHARWMAEYGRAYESEAEKERRFEIFRTNAEYIDRVNAAGDRKYALGINEFADVTENEMKAARNGFDPEKMRAGRTRTDFRYGNVSDVPPTMDWRAQGAVTAVKNQGQCGCCWAFSAVASTEGINYIATSQLFSLSEQELVDCDVGGQDQGCDGGVMDDAFQFIVDSGGLTTEADYPYAAVQGTCGAGRAGPASAPYATLGGYEDVPANSEASLLSAAAGQPVSVAIDAGGSDFQFYSGGVFTGPCGTSLDHGVAVVGYGSDEDGTDFWIVKNSWGTSWGEDGYIRMQRNVGSAEGLCGIAMSASYPTV